MTVLATMAHAGRTANVGPGHGGCGQPHKFVTGPTGVPEITCPKCEDFLRSDSQHAVNPAEVPEDHDQKIIRERDEKMGKLDRENQLAEALIELRQLGALPEALADALRAALNGAPKAVTAAVLCPQGHENPPGFDFCGKCTAPMRGAPADRQIAPPPAPREPSAPSQAPSPADGAAGGDGALAALLALHPQKLRKMCRAADLPDTGKVPEMAARLHDAGVRAA